MTDERLKYIFSQVIRSDRDQPYAGMGSPWIEGDLIYATDGGVLLCLKNKDGRDRAFEDDGTKHPHASTIFALEENNSEEVYVDLEDFDRLETVGRLLGRKISHENAGKTAHLLRLFGMTSAFVKLHGNMFEFDIYDEDGKTGALCCMCNAGKSKPAPIPTRSDVETYYYHFAMCDDSRGLAYYHKCLDDDRKAKEMNDKENFDVFVVTLKKCATICVKARTIEEAEKIAVDNISDWDFNGSAEMDCYEESCRNNEMDYRDHYYDESGEQDWDED